MCSVFKPPRYSGDLKSRTVSILMVKKRLVCKWSGFWMGSEIRKPNNLNSEQMALILSKPFEILTKMSGFPMVTTIAITKGIAPLKTGPFKIKTSKIPDFKCFRILNCQFSDPYCVPFTFTGKSSQRARSFNRWISTKETVTNHFTTTTTTTPATTSSATETWAQNKHQRRANDHRRHWGMVVHERPSRAALNSLRNLKNINTVESEIQRHNTLFILVLNNCIFSI